MNFGGWCMPLHYRTGTLAEHLACREDVAMFDVSHLGTMRVDGPDAFWTLQWAFSNDLSRIAPGSAQYTHLLDQRDGSVIDDIIIWWTGDDGFEVMPNASNTSRVVNALTDGFSRGSDRDSADIRPALVVEDVTSSRAVIAVQGPRARDKLSSVAPDAAEVRRFEVAEACVNGVQVTVAGTGYTGEDGIEMAVPAEHSASVWQALTDTGVIPAGLGARDTLRLEAGLPLHGYELGPGITPLQAGLDRVVCFEKGDFRGRSALEAERIAEPRRMLMGLLGESRRPLRGGCAVYKGDDLRGDKAGVVTSGNFSPVLDRGIALALLSPDCAVGDRMTVDVRGRALLAEVVEPPFHRLSV